MPLDIKPKADCRFDLVSLGEVMLRLDPGDGRVTTARTFQAWEGGGEYNVARGLRRCFGLDTAVVTAFADNPIGRLLQDFIYQGGVDQSYVKWVKYDGIGRSVRNGLNFTERGFGIRGAVGCSDRGNTAASQLRPGDVDWEKLFGEDGVRWLHTGGIFAALSETTAGVAEEAMKAAKKHGTIVSYDLNYRESLWKGIGGKERARAVNRGLAKHVDVMLGNEEDFTASLGFEVDNADEYFSKIDIQLLRRPPPAPPRQDGDGQRLERNLLCGRPALPVDGARRPRDLRSRGRRRLVRLRPRLRVPRWQGPAVGRRVRRRARRPRHDDARRHVDGDARRGREGHEGRRRARGSVKLPIVCAAEIIP
jgi:sugar/nucleoside kinase (ribokinase family)